MAPYKRILYYVSFLEDSLLWILSGGFFTMDPFWRILYYGSSSWTRTWASSRSCRSCRRRLLSLPSREQAKARTSRILYHGSSQNDEPRMLAHHPQLVTSISACWCRIWSIPFPRLLSAAADSEIYLLFKVPSVSMQSDGQGTQECESEIEREQTAATGSEMSACRLTRETQGHAMMSRGHEGIR